MIFRKEDFSNYYYYFKCYYSKRINLSIDLFFKKSRTL